ncbi:CAP domain-containing protein [Litorimonas sp. RW-G-Af-16]|uniref:CAP domain-containing protein n=1 Tax=Litorimonas sp. RW-G-Af-16 TaxID=3241168 RepID=UPI00390C5E08
MRYWLGATIILGSVFGLSNLANGADPIGTFEPDDGTYRTEIVTSMSDCEALCKADSDCRGTVIFQADITKPEMSCRLNNGFGENAVFPRTPPEPLDPQIAVNDLNDYRAQYGLGPVVLNTKLNIASEVHASDLAQAGIISHTGTDGSGHGDRVQRAGYYFSIAAENVATGQKSWNDVFKAWQKSPGHNENLLRDDVTEFGIALVYEPTTTYSTYWAMLVASPLPEAYQSMSN